MKKLTLIAATLALAGCSSMSTVSTNSDQIDWQKVQAVDNWARTTGATVVWLNYPQLKSEVTKQQ